MEFERRLTAPAPAPGPKAPRPADSEAIDRMARSIGEEDLAKTLIQEDLDKTLVMDSPRPTSPGSPAGAASSNALAATIAERLRAANLLQGVDGPLRCKNPERTGTVLSLRGGERLAVIETAFDAADPEWDVLARRFDALVIAGPAEEPLIISRFQQFLADQIQL
jgi:hypothetical protein